VANKLAPGVAILAATVCRRFYIEGDSKSKIADDLQLSRFQVARLLDISVAQGIIRFEISTPGGFDAELSEAVRRELGLRRAVVINIDAADNPNDPATIRQHVGAAAAAVLSETVTDSDILGIGWGRTLSAMASQLEEIARCPVVQMAGMIGSVHENSLELVRKISSIGHGRAYPLYLPLIVQDERAARSLLAQPEIAEAARLFDKITVGAVSVGSWTPPDSQLLDGLTAEDHAMLDHRDVVGEICSTLFRADGSTVDDLAARSIAPKVEQLRKIRDLVLVAGGAHKAVAVRGAVRAGLGTTLVTDSSLALEVLGR
jgi:DNA-binding transcriptional regulator LsrR (DeoR family)